jgi:hypothetical protein
MRAAKGKPGLAEKPSSLRNVIGHYEGSRQEPPICSLVGFMEVTAQAAPDQEVLLPREVRGRRPATAGPAQARELSWTYAFGTGGGYPSEWLCVALSSATIVSPGGASSAGRVWRAA